PDIDPHLEEIILHAIERIPRARYASAAEMLSELRDPGRAPLSGRAARLHPQSLRRRRVWRVVWMALFFLSLAALCILLIYLANLFPAAPAKPNRPFRAW
ncbi:MAG: hypothetical protein ACREP6_03515, partial [Candidatus Binataceae bacterium]